MDSNAEVSGIQIKSKWQPPWNDRNREGISGKCECMKGA